MSTPKYKLFSINAKTYDEHSYGVYFFANPTVFEERETIFQEKKFTSGQNRN